MDFSERTPNRDNIHSLNDQSSDMTIMEDETLTEKEFITLMKQERNLIALVDMIETSYIEKKFNSRDRLKKKFRQRILDELN